MNWKLSLRQQPEWATVCQNSVTSWILSYANKSICVRQLTFAKTCRYTQKKVLRNFKPFPTRILALKFQLGAQESLLLCNKLFKVILTSFSTNLIAYVDNNFSSKNPLTKATLCLHINQLQHQNVIVSLSVTFTKIPDQRQTYVIIAKSIN